MRIATVLDCSWPQVGAFLAALTFACLSALAATADDARILLWGDPRVEGPLISRELEPPDGHN